MQRFGTDLRQSWSLMSRDILGTLLKMNERLSHCSMRRADRFERKSRQIGGAWIGCAISYFDPNSDAQAHLGNLN
jgi:hypothetical protein